MSTESEIQAEVEALKARFSDTKTLYREVCALLFFRYGITPTTNKLYQYVRRGSMSAPADALAKFWDDLRSKARIEIDHPDLPSDVKEAAATAIAAVWRQASAAAREELRELRETVDAELVTAKSEVQTAQDLHSTLLDNIELVRGQLNAATAAVEAARTELESERRAHAASAARIQEMQRTIDELRAQFDRQRTDFSADLAKARETVEGANERADAAERRALLEIDAERQAKGRLERQLESARGQASEAEARHRHDSQAQAEIVARLQMRLSAADEAVAASVRASEVLQAQVTDLNGRVADAERRALQSQTELQTMHSLLDRLAPAPSGSPELAASGTAQDAPVQPIRAARRKR